jgi:hypothetical protein
MKVQPACVLGQLTIGSDTCSLKSLIPNLAAFKTNQRHLYLKFPCGIAHVKADYTACWSPVDKFRPHEWRSITFPVALTWSLTHIVHLMIGLES